jgi:hypothetical protein
MKRILTPAIALTALGLATAKGDILADWTFETSLPTTSGPFSPESGLQTATAQASAFGLGTISTPAGDGSAHSFSANGWTVGGYFQFSLNTVGYNNVLVSFEQTSSNTGPRDFNFQYSTDGGTTFLTDNPLSGGQSPGSSPYQVFPNAALFGNTAWSASTFQGAFQFSIDFTPITALNNASTVIFRVVDADTTAANSGSPVAASGTDRIDDFLVSATPIPEPSSLALGLAGGFLGLLTLRRKH